MAFLSPRELFDIILMSLVVGLIFKDFFRAPPRHPDELIKNVTPRWRIGRDYWFSVALVAPSIILHEFGHKFTAMAFGLEATFHAAYTWLGIALVLKYALGFVFFVPAYVSIVGVQNHVQNLASSFAGPGVNLVLWLLTLGVLASGIKLSTTQERFLHLFKYINMFLFFLNMLPIPGFDGWRVYTSIFGLL